MNLECVQQINGLADAIDSIALNRMSQPLKPSYNFKCYLLPLLNTNSSTTPAPISIHIATPLDLTKAQTQFTAPQTMQAALGELFYRFGRLFEEVGLENPWILEKSSFTTDTNVARSKRSSSSTRASEEELWRKAANKSIVLRLSELYIRANKASIFESSASKGSGSIVAIEVNSFVDNGNVLVDKTFSPSQEIEAVTKVREFLLEFANVISFDLGTWWVVVFIIKPASAPYSCTKVGKRILLHVPLGFKNRNLLDHIALNVPSIYS